MNSSKQDIIVQKAAQKCHVSHWLTPLSPMCYVLFGDTVANTFNITIRNRCICKYGNLALEFLNYVSTVTAYIL